MTLLEAGLFQYQDLQVFSCSRIHPISAQQAEIKTGGDQQPSQACRGLNRPQIIETLRNDYNGRIDGGIRFTDSRHSFDLCEVISQ